MSDKPASRVITVRLTSEQHELIKLEAAKADVSMNQYCVDKCMAGLQVPDEPQKQSTT